MRQMYHLPFGDWSHDGHGESRIITVICDNPDTFKEAEDWIKEKYGDDFFRGMADDYEDDTVSDTVWQALIETGYTAEQFMDTIDGYNMEGVKTLEECREICDHLNIEVIIDMYLHLVKAFYADFDVVEDIEMITNVAAPGYGCLG